MILTTRIEKQSIINVYSDLNEWIDYCFIVNIENETDAKNALEQAFDEWFEIDTYTTIFEHLENALKDLNIDYECKINEDEEGEF